MGQFDGFVGKFSIAALLMLSLFSFLVITQSENDASDPLINNSIFNDSFTNLVVEVEASTSEAEEKYDVFNSEEPKSALSIILTSVVSIGKTFSNIAFGVFGALIKLPLAVLGIPATGYNLILMWLIIGIIVAVWLLYKLGG